ncbi:sialidase-2-like [Lates calcarifer]|uniref:exo-alpha-sialidase n=1 Tax=Lates calcarifer TaxID=8187 RepID=A0AAJ7QJI5_LATCA|nr:sialidase-2-like [Lates calcarifer]
MDNIQTKTVDVFKSVVYRIPALFYDRNSETLLAFAEQRETADDASTKNLVMSRGTLKDESSGAKTIEWSEFKIVEKAKLLNCRPMNPCPVFEKNTNTLFLFFICVEDGVTEQWQIKNCTNKARLCYITSTDLGQTWSEEGVTELTDKLDEIKNWKTFAVGPGHGLQMKKGRLIVPVHAYACVCAPCSSCCCYITCMCSCTCSAPNALALYSDDRGSTWKLGKMFQSQSGECQMAEIFDGDKSSIYCNARSRGCCRVEAVSENGGADFHTLSNTTKLVETDSGCQGSVVSFPAQGEGADAEGDPKWLLYTHPCDPCKRFNLGVYVNKSPKDPSKWSKPWIINSGPSGYSDLAYIGNGWFACLMECGVKKETEQIASVVFSYDDIKQSTTMQCIMSCQCFKCP